MQRAGKSKSHLEQNSHLATELIETSQAADLAESISQIGYFEMKTLNLGWIQPAFSWTGLPSFASSWLKMRKEGLRC